MKKLLVSTTTLLLLLTLFLPANTSLASENPNRVQIWNGIYLSSYQEGIWQQLLSDFEIVNSVEVENYETFINENRLWIGDVNDRLEYFLNSVPYKHHADLMHLLVGGNPLNRVGQLSHYFSSHSRGIRGGFTTYTLRPTLSTRLFRATATRALEVLQVRQWNLRPYTANNRTSLRNQFWCHFDFDFETFFFGGTWDLEVERPNVGLARTIAAFCNP